MTTATSTKVELDRGAVYELLVEIHGVNTVLERLVGCDTELTRSLMLKAEPIERPLRGERDEHGHNALWLAGDRRADELMGRTSDA